MRFSRTAANWVHVVLIAGASAVLSYHLFPEWVGKILPEPWDAIAVVFMMGAGQQLTNKAFQRNWNGSDAELPAPPDPKRRRR